MHHRFNLGITVFLLAAIGHAAPSASVVPGPNARLEVLVDGSPLPHYAARGTWYIEALKGREYEIRIRNPFPVRVAVALSVDGLNTIDARQTTAAAARKWVLGPYETITIGGWQTSQTHARRFQFTSEEKSYGQWLGKTNDLGIISAVFFRERMPERVVSAGPVTAPRAEPSAPPADAKRRMEADATSLKGANAPQAARSQARETDEYAATGLGQRTDHAVRQVYLDLEETAAASISIRYEYRPQLVRLGILPARPADDDPLVRRERARGFDPGFCPEPKREKQR